MGPGTLRQVMQCLPVMNDPNLLVGLDSIDDAGVYKLNDDTALIQTVDFFTPVVDDPYHFGQIAAANALSDVYAMGGEPLTVMNLVAFPSKKLDISILGRILQGGAAKALEAGAVLVGGHSIEDAEPKYGLAVTGVVHPDKIITNCGAKPGDKLILTKPLGTGIIATAIKAGVAEAETIEAAVSIMATLNRSAAKAMTETGVNACTDITGFGLLGHSLEMAEGSGVDLVIRTKEVPTIRRAVELAAMGMVPGGTYNNRRHVESEIREEAVVATEIWDILYDPQTSGGLLIAVKEEKAEELMAALDRQGVTGAAVIGEAVCGTGKILLY